MPATSHCYQPFYQDNELMDYLKQMGEHTTVEIGSSLKFCLVAEGKQCFTHVLGLQIFGTLQLDMRLPLVQGQKSLIGMENARLYPRESFLNPGFRVILF